MAYKKKTPQQAAQSPTKAMYEVVAPELRGQVNNTKYTGKCGDVIELEPWVAVIFCAYVREVQS